MWSVSVFSPEKVLSNLFALRSRLLVWSMAGRLKRQVMMALRNWLRVPASSRNLKFIRSPEGFRREGTWLAWGVHLPTSLSQFLGISTYVEFFDVALKFLSLLFEKALTYSFVSSRAGDRGVETFPALAGPIHSYFLFPTAKQHVFTTYSSPANRLHFWG